MYTPGRRSAIAQMKNPFLPGLALVLGAILHASGQMPVAPAHPHSLSLQVEPLSTGGAVDESVATRDRSVSGEHANKKEAQMRTTRAQTSKSSVSIEISVRNFGTVPDAAQVEWYFMAAPAHLEPGKSAIDQTFVFDKGAQNVSLAANGTARIPATSKEATVETTRKAGFHTGKFHGVHNGGAQETGDVLSGWIVRVVADGKMIEARASRQELEDLARDHARLDAAAKP